MDEIDFINAVNEHEIPDLGGVTSILPKPSVSPQSKSPDNAVHSSSLSSSPTPLPPKTSPTSDPLDAKQLLSSRRWQRPVGCTVPACRRLNCSLRTHRYYAKWTAIATAAAHKSRMQQKKHQDSLKQKSVLPAVIGKGVDGLPVLPIDGMQTPVFKDMFHQFFNDLYDRIVTILVPPPIGTSQRATATKNKEIAVASALSNPVYCLNYIASAYFTYVFRAQGFAPDRMTTMLYGKVMQLLRQKLDNFDDNDIDNMLLVILTLVMFDIAIGNFNSLDIHRKGMYQLVSRHGGLHNLGRSLVFVLNLDRMISIHSWEFPLYANRMPRGLQLPARFPFVYGAAFDSAKFVAMLDDQDVTYYCHDACRAIELLEGHNISFDPEKAKTEVLADTHYFYFLRNRLANEFCHLSASYSDNHGSSRCILLACKIVEYIVLMDNYVVSIPGFLASKIYESLEMQDVEKEWNGMEKALDWVLWVLTIIRDRWKGESFAWSLLKSRLEAKYQTEFLRKSWKQAELDNVRQFVWCDTRLNESFVQTCRRLQDSEDSD